MLQAVLREQDEDESEEHRADAFIRPYGDEGADGIGFLPAEAAAVLRLQRFRQHEDSDEAVQKS
jgi:hypothetical protein